MKNCIALGKDAGKDWTDETLQLEIRLEGGRTLKTIMSEHEYYVISAVIKRAISPFGGENGKNL